jgi:hypothetical protein
VYPIGSPVADQYSGTDIAGPPVMFATTPANATNGPPRSPARIGSSSADVR